MHLECRKSMSDAAQLSLSQEEKLFSSVIYQICLTLFYFALLSSVSVVFFISFDKIPQFFLYDSIFISQ